MLFLYQVAQVSTIAVTAKPIASIVTFIGSFKLIDTKYHLHQHQTKSINPNLMLNFDFLCFCFTIDFRFSFIFAVSLSQIIHFQVASFCPNLVIVSSHSLRSTY